MPLAHPQALRFLVLGDLTPENDVGLVLEAFGDFARTYPAATLMIVGEGAERSHLEQRISEMCLADVVGLPGSVSQGRLIELIQRTHVFVLPRTAGASHRVPPALAVAMAGALCVIASDVGSVGRMLHDGVDGLLVPPGDHPALLRAMHLVAGHPTLRTQLGERAAAGVRGVRRSA